MADVSVEASHLPLYRGFFLRFCSAVIDMVIWIIALIPISAFYGQFLYRSTGHPQLVLQPVFSDKLSSSSTVGELWNNFLADERVVTFAAQGGWERLVADQLLQLFIALMAVFLCWRFWGATPGKKLLGMRIVNAEDSSSLSYRQCILRLSALVFVSAPSFVGIAWIFWDKRKQAWHDKIARTAVVSKSSLPSAIS